MGWSPHDGVPLDVGSYRGIGMNSVVGPKCCRAVVIAYCALMLIASVVVGTISIVMQLSLSEDSPMPHVLKVRRVLAASLATSVVLFTSGLLGATASAANNHRLLNFFLFCLWALEFLEISVGISALIYLEQLNSDVYDEDNCPKCGPSIRLSTSGLKAAAFLLFIGFVQILLIIITLRFLRFLKMWNKRVESCDTLTSLPGQAGSNGQVISRSSAHKDVIDTFSGPSKIELTPIPTILTTLMTSDPPYRILENEAVTPDTPYPTSVTPNTRHPSAVTPQGVTPDLRGASLPIIGLLTSGQPYRPLENEVITPDFRRASGPS